MFKFNNKLKTLSQPGNTFFHVEPTIFLQRRNQAVHTVLQSEINEEILNVVPLKPPQN